MKRICKLWRILSAIAVLAMIGVCCWHCIDIYTLSEQNVGLQHESMFTMADVGSRMQASAPLLGVCLGAIVIAFVLEYKVSSEQQTTDPVPAYQLKQLKMRQQTLPEAAQQEENRRKRLHIVGTITIIVLVLPAVIYLLDRRNFFDWDLENVMADTICHTVPWLLMALSAATIVLHISEQSIRHEVQILRSSTGADQMPSRNTIPKQRLCAMRWGIFIVALLLVILGVLNGGWYDMLVKAINICTECIGLG